ncbi:MAG TPA: hypothetical protein VLE72_00675 [Candidatus Saccharimonadales bacterium]|nr:hypothetical protein [Candidatus Saccharimonadales bacterium]
MSNQKPVVAIDIDDVLSPHYDLLQAHINKSFDVDLSIMEIRNLETLMAQTGTDLDGIVRSIDNFIISDAFYNDPMPGALEAIELLKHQYHLVIATARPTLIKDRTEAWVHYHFPKAFNNVDFVGGVSWGTPTADKAPVLAKMGTKILIDDSLRHCLGAAEIGIEALLFGDYSWNQSDLLPANVTRVCDWPEVIDRLL